VIHSGGTARRLHAEPRIGRVAKNDLTFRRHMTRRSFGHAHAFTGGQEPLRKCVSHLTGAEEPCNSAFMIERNRSKSRHQATHQH
jgi:hypothetical protein